MTLHEAIAEIEADLETCMRHNQRAARKSRSTDDMAKVAKWIGIELQWLAQSDALHRTLGRLRGVGEGDETGAAP